MKHLMRVNFEPNAKVIKLFRLSAVEGRVGQEGEVYNPLLSG